MNKENINIQKLTKPRLKLDVIIKQFSECTLSLDNWDHYARIYIVYYSLIKYVRFVSGNSSSLLYEVPLFKKISLNIGIRQLGRTRNHSVINSKANIKDIENKMIIIDKKITNFKNFKNIFFKKNPTDLALKVIRLACK